MNNRRIFLVWKIYQRRVESLADELDLLTCHYHYKWEERSKFLKAASYLFKFINTLLDLFRIKPEYVFMQLPPTPLIYATAIYCRIHNAKYISDCHNAMIYGANWNRWPLARRLLRESFLILVHNNDVEERAKKINLSPFVLRDPLPKMDDKLDGKFIRQLKLDNQRYIMAPFAFAADEPIDELFNAASMLSEITFVMTWFTERLTAEQERNAPGNILFTGYIEADLYNDLLLHAGAVLALTNREGTQPSVASEAISARVPLIITKLKTTTMLYGDAPIYVENTADSIVSGVKYAMQNRATSKLKISKYRDKYEEELCHEINYIKEYMAIN